MLESSERVGHLSDIYQRKCEPLSDPGPARSESSMLRGSTAAALVERRPNFALVAPPACLCIVKTNRKAEPAPCRHTKSPKPLDDENREEAVAAVPVADTWLVGEVTGDANGSDTNDGTVCLLAWAAEGAAAAGPGLDTAQWHQCNHSGSTTSKCYQ